MHRVKVPALARVMPLDPQESQHLRVLRLRVGAQVQVFDGEGGEARATVIRLDEGGAMLELGERVENDRETPQPVTLAVALLKGDKLSDVVRAATELGVARVQLLQTRYADVPEIGDAKLVRLRRVAAEASKQSRRAVTPDVLAPIPVSKLVLDGQGFLAHPGSAARVTDSLDWSAPVTFVSGPEGGFSDAEVAALTASGFVSVTLGPRILRAETAPLALLGAVAATGV
ncbi:16S rRNA (uracil(1498)-N(3))-methyltransferase [Deinococcus aquiradiocola]|uniref:Ribosomal RNA small subunit methyltransferase E n=1 Tax=Deinococcus aquiradiocola TaxID=393059 RepID=A0A917PFZ1_9DEIO|nr:16S rRNA (uracil(1498)-N(3))-methyltransferase [Deinococcus aquiradiocola]GGJ75037.1 ribosomal RNA small subunit methyltransferase E [Deinococcus aquiradiocola]